MAEPLISVVTVCLDAAAALPATIASLQRQSWQRREWIVVDGGSRDGTQAVIAQARERPAWFVSEPDRGIYDAMNKALAHARGDIVFFLNADDHLHDDAVLADVAAAFAADAGLGLLVGGVVIEGRLPLVERRYRHVNRLTLPYEDLCHQAVFARLELFDRFGRFDPRWPTSADYAWLLRVFRAGAKVRVIDRLVAGYQAAGAHARDPAALAAERRAIRLEHVSPARLACGLFAVRAAHRLSKLLRGGLRIGETRHHA